MISKKEMDLRHAQLDAATLESLKVMWERDELSITDYAYVFPRLLSEVGEGCLVTVSGPRGVTRAIVPPGAALGDVIEAINGSGIGAKATMGGEGSSKHAVFGATLDDETIAQTVVDIESVKAPDPQQLLKEAVDKFIEGFAKQVEAGQVRMDSISDLERALKIKSDFDRVYRQGRLDTVIEHVKKCPIQQRGNQARGLAVSSDMIEWLDALKSMAR